MIPLILHGHTRSLTFVTFNADGDLLFTCGKDTRPTVWWAHSGERLGTFDGHSGSVWTCTVTRDSSMVITGSADNSARLWRVRNGECLFEWIHHGPVRTAAWSEDETQFLTVTDTFAGKPCQINIFDYSEDRSQQASTPKLIIHDPDNQRVKITCAAWLPLDKAIITANEKGQVRVYDPKTGECTKTIAAHDGNISSLTFNKEKSLMLTSSADQSCKLWDLKTMKTIKVYSTNTPLNAAALSPVMDHVFMAGGQEARSVTTTAAGAGKFETRIYHTIFEKELGRIKGHFGPVNTLAIHPSGRGFVTGGEDGFVRVHYFDEDYFQLGDEGDLDAEPVNKAIELGIGHGKGTAEEDEIELPKIPEELVAKAVEASRPSKSKSK